MVLKSEGWERQAWWISGQSGTGKTTLARIIAEMGADSYNINELDGKSLTLGALNNLADMWRHYPLGAKPGWVLIVNEAHGLRSDIIIRMLDLLESLPAQVAVIFTTTSEGQANLFEQKMDTAPLLSRCNVLELSRRNLSQHFAKRCQWIAQKEGLDGQPIEKYVKLAQNCKNNMRAMLKAIGKGVMVAG